MVHHMSIHHILDTGITSTTRNNENNVNNIHPTSLIHPSNQ